MTKTTIDLFRNLLNQVTIQVGDQAFKENVKIIAQAEKDLNAAEKALPAA
jgi:hypothetical protein